MAWFDKRPKQLHSIQEAATYFSHLVKAPENSDLGFDCQIFLILAYYFARKMYESKQFQMDLPNGRRFVLDMLERAYNELLAVRRKANQQDQVPDRMFYIYPDGYTTYGGRLPEHKITIFHPYIRRNEARDMHKRTFHVKNRFLPVVIERTDDHEPSES